jgi:hypothetical protein
MVSSTPEHDGTSAYEAVSEPDATALGVPAGLYERARRYLLENEPLRARSSEGTSIPHALSATEIDALQSVGLSTERWSRGGRTDPLAQSIADYMALLDTSLTTSQAAKYLKVDPSRIRQRLRERSLYGIEYDGASAGHPRARGGPGGIACPTESARCRRMVPFAKPGPRTPESVGTDQSPRVVVERQSGSGSCCARAQLRIVNAEWRSSRIHPGRARLPASILQYGSSQPAHALPASTTHGVDTRCGGTSSVISAHSTHVGIIICLIPPAPP